MAKTNNKAEKKAEKKAKVKAGKTKGKAVASDDIGGVEVAGFDLGSLMDDVLDGIEKKTKVSSQDAARHAPRISTGVLALDMYLDGGIVPGGWYTFSGGEQSCKSTMTMSIMASLIRLKYSGISVVFDYEGSTDADYVAGQLKTFGVTVDAKTIFGVRDGDDGNWIIKPRIRYYAPDNGERFFDYMSMLRRRLPDKIVDKDGSSYYIFENNKENAKKVAGKYDKKWFSRNNQFKVPASDGHMQAMVIVDSYPAMMPDQVDDDDGSKAMALQARMFSDGIKRFRGGMRRKMMTIVGVNQLRQKPAVMFGSPEYEPGGDALKFYCFDRDTLIRTDHGVMTAPDIAQLLKDGVKVCVESFDGYQQINGAWKVEDAPFPIELSAGGHSYIGSAEHRQFVLVPGVTADGTNVFYPEWRTLNEMATGGHEGVYAGLRVPPVKELKQNVPDAFDEASQLVSSLLANCDPVSVQLPLAAHGDTTYAANVLTIDVVGESTDSSDFSFWAKKLLDIGVFAYADERGIHMPGLNKHELEEAVAQDADGAFRGLSYAATCRQRQTQMLIAIADRFPELTRYVLDYQLQVGEAKIYLAPENDFAEALDLILHREIDGYDDLYDLLMQQLAYVEDWYNFDSSILPVPFSLKVLNKEVEFWDVNVAETSVVITNGFVSHNSDVRVRLASRAVPDAGWTKLKDAPGVVGEKSVTIEGGTDRYRFIAAKTIKNKMGGIPNQQTWLRLWEADGNGEARGFDPVFDTWHYLKVLGLINGTRKSFKIKAPCPLASEVKMDWDDFRTLINGTKTQVVDVCKKLKVKPAGLRLWCFKFVQSAKGKEMLKASISKSAKTSGDEDDE